MGFHPRVVCVGGNIESMITLEGLRDINANIVGVITSLESSERRGTDYKNLGPFCDSSRIPIHRTSDINDSNSKAFLRTCKPDVVFILGWSQIFDEELIAISRVLGSHPSKLPYGAGRAPVSWTVIENLKTSAITIFEVTKQVDAGALVYQSEFSIPENPTSQIVYDIIAQKLKIGFVEVYRRLGENSLIPIKQNPGARTVRAKRTPRDGKLKFAAGARSVDLLVRSAGDPFPGAYTYFREKKIIIWKSELVTSWHHKGTEGQVLRKKQGRLLVQCRDQPIWLWDITDDKGNKVSPKEFPLGCSLGLAIEDEIFELKYELKCLKELLLKNGII